MNDPILALDTASPVVSLAAGRVGGRIAQRQIDLRQSSERLFHVIDEVLGELDLRIDQLAGVVTLRGPGSFTGLRVGMGAVLGLHQALDLPATALPTLPILARTVDAAPGERLVAAVDALRGDWYAQPFVAGEIDSLGEAGLQPAAELARWAPCTVVGFGVAALAEALDGTGIRLVEAPPLAPFALRWAAEHEQSWDASLLTRPIYFRAPAVTLAKTRPKPASSP